MPMGLTIGLGMQDRPRAAPFVATAYGTPLFWYDPDLASSYTLDGSSRLSQWNDLSATGANMTQATAANRLYRATRNGYGCFQGTNASGTFINTAASAFGGALGTITAFIVVSGMNDQGGSGLFNFVNNFAGSSDFESQRLDVESTTGGISVFGAQGNPILLSGIMTNANWSVVTLQIDQAGLSSSLQINKGAAGIDAYSGLDLALTKMGLGTRFLSGVWEPANSLDFYVRHFVGYGSKLSAPTISAIQTALAATCGVSI